ncbi:DHA2 family efflux MFS transporter permease subunit [Paenochrobactrum sp. BZR 588]|uniref:DHA2 family efflux MFS transporter permease subunit n=1 Tax=unclassified Paenochrobactrum TaxID=2639760 RepID=UPI0038525B2E
MSLKGRPVAVAAVYLGTFMATLAISIVSVALPAIQAGLQTSMAGLQWVVGAYTLCLSAFMLSAGPLADRYGRKRVWLGGVSLFTLGSAVCAFAGSLTVLIIGCSLQGIAGALVIPGALSILTQAYPDPAERAHIIGGWSSFSAVSLILGPMLGGFMVDQAGWPSIFLLNLPIGAVTFALGFISIEESSNPDHAALDPAGQVLSIVFLGSLTLGLINAGQSGWAAFEAVVPLAVAVIALCAFILVEMNVKRPVLPVDLFKQRPFASANFASFVLGFSGYTSLFLFSLFLQRGQGWSATEAGWRMAPVFAAMLVVASCFGTLAKRFGVNQLMVGGYVLIGVSMTAMLSFSSMTSYMTIALLFALLGVGLGLAVPSTGAAAMASAPRERTGTASATMNALRQGGMTIGIALLGTLMSVRAVNVLEKSLSYLDVGDMRESAAFAIRMHEKPANLDVDTGIFNQLLTEALAQGFTLAAIVAGILGFMAALILAYSTYKVRSTAD